MYILRDSSQTQSAYTDNTQAASVLHFAHIIAMSYNSRINQCVAAKCTFLVKANYEIFMIRDYCDETQV